MKSLYDKYYNILKHVYNIMNLTSNEELKDLSKQTIINLVNQLCEKDKTNEKLYQSILDEFGLKEKTDDKIIEQSIESQVEKEEKESIVESQTEKNIPIFETKKDENINEVTQNKEKTVDSVKEETYKIKKVKKSYNSKLKNKALSLLALAGLGTFNPILGTAIGVGGYYLYKRGIKNAKSLIEKNGLNIDENNNLIDSKGNIVKKEDIGKLQYNLIKRELFKNDKSGRIDNNYKKNKLTSMLLNIPIIKKVNNKFGKIKTSNEEDSLEIKDMNKGLGILK